MPGYHREYLKFYQFANSNLFTHRLIFFSREATSETYDPRVLFLIYLPLRSTFSLLLFLDLLNQKYKNTLLHFILFAIYLSNILQPFYRHAPIFGAVTRKGLTTPLTRRVARCYYLCAGAAYVVLLGSPTGSIPWFDN